MSSFDVCLLRTFVSAAEQDYEDRSLAYEVDPVSWSNIDPCFGNTTPYRLDVSEIIVCETSNPHRYSGLGPCIRKLLKPGYKRRGLFNIHSLKSVFEYRLEEISRLTGRAHTKQKMIFDKRTDLLADATRVMTEPCCPR
jgi:hypothetical protein